MYCWIHFVLFSPLRNLGKSKVLRSRCCWSIECGKSMVWTEWLTETITNENCWSGQYNQVSNVTCLCSILVQFNQISCLFSVNRCSSCGLRHPRKPTGRPHYAARQCNTCKIRHTAREVRRLWWEPTEFTLVIGTEMIFVNLILGRHLGRDVIFRFTLEILGADGRESTGYHWVGKLSKGRPFTFTTKLTYRSV